MNEPHAFGRFAFVFASALAVLLLSASCSAFPEDLMFSDTAVPAPAMKQPVADPVAQLTVFKDGVQAGMAPDALKPAHTGGTLGAGWLIRTDATGLAAATLPDGSLMRLGANTEMTVSGMSAGGTAMTAGIGQSWHRMDSRATASEHSVKTPVGQITGASPDAIFSVECPVITRCELSVFDGTVTAIPVSGDAVTVSAFQRLVLSQAGAESSTEASTLPVDAILHNQWSRMNLSLDEREVAPPELAVASPFVLAAATLAGTWAIDTIIVSSDNPGTPPGTQTHRDWEFRAATCADLCSMPLTRTFGDTGKSVSDKVEENLIYGPAGFQAYREFVDDCTSIDGSVIAADAFEKTSTYDLHVTAVEIRAGIPTATKLEGTATSTVRLAAGAVDSGCATVSEVPDRYSVSGVLVTSEPLPALTPPPNAQRIPLEAAPLDEPPTGALKPNAAGAASRCLPVNTLN